MNSGLFSAIITHPVVLVGLGSAAGGIARHYVGLLLNPKETGFPWGTLAVNALGTLVLSTLAYAVMDRLPAQYRSLYLLVGTGFCGGFTTFSTFQWELFRLVQIDRPALALGYLAASLMAGFVGVVAGVGLVLLGRLATT